MWRCMWHHASSLLALCTTIVNLTISHCTLYKRQYYISTYFHLYTLGYKWQNKRFWTVGPNGSSHFQNLICSCFLMGYTVVQLVGALQYKLEGHGLDFQYGHWNFSLTVSFWPHYGPGVESVCNWNEYQGYIMGGGEGGWYVGLTNLPPSCADYLEIWEP